MPRGIVKVLVQRRSSCAAVTYGYQRFDHTVMIATIVILILTVAVVQLVGDALVRFTTPHQRALRTA